MEKLMQLPSPDVCTAHQVPPTSPLERANAHLVCWASEGPGPARDKRDDTAGGGGSPVEPHKEGAQQRALPSPTGLPVPGRE